MKRYVWNIVQALNRLINTLFGGTDKEYMSSRIYRHKADNLVAGWCYQILNWIETDHCEKAYADCQIGMDINDEVWK